MDLAHTDLADLGLAERQGFLDCADHNARATAVVVKSTKYIDDRHRTRCSCGIFEKAVDRNFHNSQAQFTTFCHACSAAGGSLSICLRNKARVQISRSVRVPFHDGIPVHRMPCLIFQKEKASGSSSTPSVASCGGCG